MNDQIVIDAMFAEAERLGSGKKLAMQLGISEQYLSDILNNRRSVSEVVGLRMGYRAMWVKDKQEKRKATP